MNVIILLLAEHSEIIQIIIVGSIGSLIGELLKETTNDTPIVLGKALAQFSASWFMAVLSGVLFKTYIMKSEQVAAILITGFLAFKGHKNSTEIFHGLISKLLEVKDVKTNTDNSEKNQGG